MGPCWLHEFCVEDFGCCFGVLILGSQCFCGLSTASCLGCEYEHEESILQSMVYEGCAGLVACQFCFYIVSVE